MGLGIVIPARGLTDGKRRLAGVLSESERMQLNRHLLRHVTGVACAAARTHGQRAMVAVVSPDPLTLGFARRCGAMSLLESHALGLNAAVEWAIRQLALLGAQAVAVVPSDLPRLRVDELVDLLAGDPDEVLIAPDLAGTGTNGLRLPVRAGVVPAFGPGSRVAHESAARAAGCTLRLIERQGLAMDIDTADDLAAWRAQDGTAWRAEAA